MCAVTAHKTTEEAPDLFGLPDELTLNRGQSHPPVPLTSLCQSEVASCVRLLLRPAGLARRIGFRIANCKLVVRFDERSVSEGHEERLLGVDNPTAIFVLQHGDLFVRFHVDGAAIADESQLSVIGHGDPAV